MTNKFDPLHVSGIISPATMLLRASTIALIATHLLPCALSSPLQPNTSPDVFPNIDQWPFSTVGKAIEQQLPDADLQAVIAQVSRANTEATVRKLASFGTRHTLSSQTDPHRGIGAARDWLTTQFEAAAAASNGSMTVSWNSFIKYPGDNERIIFPVNITTVVATLIGSEDPKRLYVVGGHYDSRNSDPVDNEGDAPGAVDE